MWSIIKSSLGVASLSQKIESLDLDNSNACTASVTMNMIISMKWIISRARCVGAAAADHNLVCAVVTAN